MHRIDNAVVRLTTLVLAASLIAFSSTSALSNENSCRRLEDLALQYAGVQLTSQQQHLKRKLVAWYNGNCKRTREARR